MSNYTLYSYFRSSCSARLRIALNVKGIPYELISVNLLKGEQLSEAHKTLNPSATVPLLICPQPDGGYIKIGQSVAAMEFLEEMHPDNPILPPISDAKSRAIVRTLTEIICTDTQPVTNLKITRRITELGGSAESWSQGLMISGLNAFEAVAKDWAGTCSVGDSITIADACLIPAIWNAQMNGVDTTAFSTINRVFNHLSSHPAVVRAYYLNQPDTPEAMRPQ